MNLPPLPSPAAGGGIRTAPHPARPSSAMPRRGRDDGYYEDSDASMSDEDESEEDTDDEHTGSSESGSDDSYDSEEDEWMRWGPCS